MEESTPSAPPSSGRALSSPSGGSPRAVGSPREGLQEPSEARNRSPLAFFVRHQFGDESNRRICAREWRHADSPEDACASEGGMRGAGPGRGGEKACNRKRSRRNRHGARGRADAHHAGAQGLSTAPCGDTAANPSSHCAAEEPRGDASHCLLDARAGGAGKAEEGRASNQGEEEKGAARVTAPLGAPGSLPLSSDAAPTSGASPCSAASTWSFSSAPASLSASPLSSINRRFSLVYLHPHPDGVVAALPQLCATACTASEVLQAVWGEPSAAERQEDAAARAAAQAGRREEVDTRQAPEASAGGGAERGADGGKQIAAERGREGDERLSCCRAQGLAAEGNAGLSTNGAEDGRQRSGLCALVQSLQAKELADKEDWLRRRMTEIGAMTPEAAAALVGRPAALWAAAVHKMMEGYVEKRFLLPPVCHGAEEGKRLSLTLPQDKAAGRPAVSLPPLALAEHYVFRHFNGLAVVGLSAKGVAPTGGDADARQACTRDAHASAPAEALERPLSSFSNSKSPASDASSAPRTPGVFPIPSLSSFGSAHASQSSPARGYEASRPWWRRVRLSIRDGVRANCVSGKRKRGAFFLQGDTLVAILSFEERVRFPRHAQGEDGEFGAAAACAAHKLLKQSGEGCGGRVGTERGDAEAETPGGAPVGAETDAKTWTAGAAAQRSNADTRVENELDGQETRREGPQTASAKKGETADVHTGKTERDAALSLGAGESERAAGSTASSLRPSPLPSPPPRAHDEKPQEAREPEDEAAEGGGQGEGKDAKIKARERRRGGRKRKWSQAAETAFFASTESAQKLENATGPARGDKKTAEESPEGEDGLEEETRVEVDEQGIQWQWVPRRLPVYACVRGTLIEFNNAVIERPELLLSQNPELSSALQNPELSSALWYPELSSALWYPEFSSALRYPELPSALQNPKVAEGVARTTTRSPRLPPSQVKGHDRAKSMVVAFFNEPTRTFMLEKNRLGAVRLCVSLIDAA
ncbi:hypothetical protein BESB_030780 [Besnoitia besnoiti]|uniref:Uncharacterized protein n=1 Tax=Besnoitia besnoiti TaxID=94643 RepID=A0A2A9M1T4_BESBE|nr:hypothetical protein BESB_030780 [Besnoitia besnoiti]PFH31204.1 hypothetical protein BESB_030780 [Besnoitia besnoiti]